MCSEGVAAPVRAQGGAAQLCNPPAMPASGVFITVVEVSTVVELRCERLNFDSFCSAVCFQKLLMEIFMSDLDFASLKPISKKKSAIFFWNFCIIWQTQTDFRLNSFIPEPPLPASIVLKVTCSLNNRSGRSHLCTFFCFPFFSGIKFLFLETLKLISCKRVCQRSTLMKNRFHCTLKKKLYIFLHWLFHALNCSLITFLVLILKDFCWNECDFAVGWGRLLSCCIFIFFQHLFLIWDLDRQWKLTDDQRV